MEDEGRGQSDTQGNPKDGSELGRTADCCLVIESDLKSGIQNPQLTVAQSSIFINKVLIEHCHLHLFTHYCVASASLVGQSACQKGCMSPKVRNIYYLVFHSTVLQVLL